MLFGKEALKAWPVKDIGKDIVARRIPVDHTIGYEANLMLPIDDEGNIGDPYLDVNAPIERFLANGFGDLRNKVFRTINPQGSASTLDLSRSEVVKEGEIKEHIIFELARPYLGFFSSAATKK